MYDFFQDGTHNLKLLRKQAGLLQLLNITNICYGHNIVIWVWFGTGLRTE